MSDKRNELLLAALKRAGRPSHSGELLDAMVGLGEAEGWSDAELAAITRGSVAKRLEQMVRAKTAKQVADTFDASSRRMTPQFEPADGYEPKYPVPPPPITSIEPPSSAYDAMSPQQLLAVLDAQDEMLEAVARFFTDMRHVRERARQRLIAAGVVR